MKHPRIAAMAAALTALAASTLGTPGSARACGGTFCDGGPASMPVLQRGENILFVMGDSSVEAHIQIQYKGAAKKFAWVLPVPTVPTLAVGSQPLFTNLLAATVPSYGYSIRRDFCGTTAFASSSECGVGPGVASSSGSGGVDGGGPEVVYEATVGSFDVTVLSGGTAQEVSDWLANNGYATTAGTPGALKKYTDKSYVFVAVRLTGESNVEEIHPLVVTYPGNMPCVPLILTAEAALDNMGVRAFFLGKKGRVFPENYASVTLNEARIDWLTLGANYDLAVAHAVDEAPHGHGFVTEYFGDSASVSRFGVYDPKWNSAAFQAIAPEQVVVELGNQALAICGVGFCTWQHPLVLGLLHQYLPPPNGTSDDAWYPDLPSHAAQIDMNAWNATNFANDFEARVVRPGKRAIDALDRHQFLTRLYTLISPPEMTADPTFNERADLSTPVGANHSTVETIDCCSNVAMRVVEGTVALPTGQWPLWSSSMPFARTIESVPAQGAPTTLIDNTKKIEGILAMWNIEHGGLPCMAGVGGAGAGGGSSGNGAAGTGSGCACGTAGRDGVGAAALAAGALALVLGLRRRSARRR